MYSYDLVPDGTLVAATISVPFDGSAFPSDPEFLDVVIMVVDPATAPTLEVQYQVWNASTNTWVTKATVSGLNVDGTTSIPLVQGDQGGSAPSQVVLTLGGAAIATTVALGSNGGEISTIASWSVPSAGVLDIASDAGFPVGGGVVHVAASGATTAVVDFTGVAVGELIGCTYVTGSPAGTVATGNAVTLVPSPAFVLDLHLRA